ncbi:MAG: hypothetical protein SWQ30_21370 [Thermodesulfobacteriota bacterium]|nr:hypothetical protein [Thermodesulfobacteriota bacterium]
MTPVFFPFVSGVSFVPHAVGKKGPGSPGGEGMYQDHADPFDDDPYVNVEQTLLFWGAGYHKEKGSSMR